MLFLEVIVLATAAEPYLKVMFGSYIADCCSEAILGVIFESHIWEPFWKPFWKSYCWATF